MFSIQFSCAMIGFTWLLAMVTHPQMPVAVFAVFAVLLSLLGLLQESAVH